MDEDWVGNVRVEYALSNDAGDMTPTYVSNSKDFFFWFEEVVNPGEGHSIMFWILLGLSIIFASMVVVIVIKMFI